MNAYTPEVPEWLDRLDPVAWLVGAAVVGLTVSAVVLSPDQAPAPVETVNCTHEWVLEQQLEAVMDSAYGRGDIPAWERARVARARLVGYGPAQCWEASLRASMRAEADAPSVSTH